ncbi:MAG: hypothetical protein AMJ56_14920 [Anaerolineae bacterium SG8_19]|jgi:CheY-like chemotaxis protein|nr:MAG: hypothetical protein AMJ56_14920 [Anaerolineae bacterium SG8_19]
MTKFILYVEDHLYNMLLVKRIVLAEGHKFLAAENGEEGWHRYDLLKAAVELDRDEINARPAGPCLMPQDAPLINILEVQMTGADLHLVNGLINDAGREAAAAAAEANWFDVSTLKEPYRIEGKKLWVTKWPWLLTGNYLM